MPRESLRRTSGGGSLRTDDRGAIMVLGIFMCVFLVGALWYIAGIGDAFIYHERMQEAADAVAFSAATIQARGMNIIVLLNLLMAAILAIRVAVNMVKFALLVLTGVFAAIGAIPFMEEFLGFATICANGAETMAQVDQDLKQPIDTALEALNGAEKLVKYATPPAAFLGAQEIASKYQPIVDSLPSGKAALIFGSTIGTGGNGPGGSGSSGGGTSSGSSVGLPVVDGTADKLCAEAFTATSDLVKDAVPGFAKAALGGLIDGLGSIVEGIGVADAFCELGGTSSPDLSAATTAAASSQCQSQAKPYCDASQTALTKLQADQTSCNGYQPGDPQSTPPSSCQLQVESDNSDYQAKDGKCHQFDDCKDKTNNKDKQTEAQKRAPPASASSSNSGGDKNPSQVDPAWQNGVDAGQIVGVVLASKSGSAFVNQAPKFEQIASRFSGKKVSYDKPGEIAGLNLGSIDPSMNAWAQAEFFYDCSGDWLTCNDKEEAMWNFHWRARFRLVNPDVFLLGSYIKAADAAMKLKMGVDLAHYVAKWTNEGLSVTTAVQAVTPAELTTALAPEPQLTLH